MNDKLLMTNYLMALKSTIEVYVHGTLESSNEDVKKTLKCGLDRTIESQKNTYDEMVENGWYQIQNIKTSDIKKVIDNLE